MQCIFCKQDSSTSVSKEHIIPESLGNTKHILHRGIVCDKCNNYFARKVEKPILDSDYFTQARFHNFLANKRGLIPALENLVGPEGVNLGAFRDKNWMTHLYPTNLKDESKFINYLRQNSCGNIYFPVASKVDAYLISRFLAKIALEILAFRVIPLPGWEDEVIFRNELDEIRNFSRYGDLKNKWEFYERRLYEYNHRFTSEGGNDYEILHEFNLLYTKSQELLAVIVILGVEYTISLCNREINGYKKWLKENHYNSPLYFS